MPTLNSDTIISYLHRITIGRLYKIPAKFLCIIAGVGSLCRLTKFGTKLCANCHLTKNAGRDALRGEILKRVHGPPPITDVIISNVIFKVGGV